MTQRATTKCGYLMRWAWPDISAFSRQRCNSHKGCPPQITLSAPKVSLLHSNLTFHYLGTCGATWPRGPRFDIWITRIKQQQWYSVMQFLLFGHCLLRTCFYWFLLPLYFFFQCCQHHKWKVIDLNCINAQAEFSGMDALKPWQMKPKLTASLELLDIKE